MAKKNPLETALERFQAKMDKSYGDGVFERSQIRPYEVVSTGSITLDRALSVGGYVEGRLYEIWGQEQWSQQQQQCIESMEGAMEVLAELGL